MREGKGFYKNVLDNLYDGVYIVDRERRITYWNKAAERITGYKSAKIVGALCSDNILVHIDSGGHNLCKGECPLSKAMDEDRAQEADVYLHHREGHRLPVRVCGVPLKDPKGKIVGAVEIFSDNSAKAVLGQKMEELRRLALLDSLTGLPNRRFVEIGLRSRLNETKRYGWRFGLLFIDIDRFKSVNDFYGHEIGDRVLKMVSRTLVYNVRSFDTVGRWGGDEFVALIINTGKEELCRVADKLCVLVEHSGLLVGGDTVRVTVSIGAAVVRPDDSLETLLKRADRLMYQSKLDGRNRVTADQG